MTDEQEERILSEIVALRAMLEERLPKPKAKARPNTGKGKYGEHKNVRLTEKEYEALREQWGDMLDVGIRVLGEHMFVKGVKYANHAYMLRCKWPTEHMGSNAKNNLWS